MKNKHPPNQQELIRKHYLKLMGIRNWYPKFKFANAKLARDLSCLPATTTELCLATQKNYLSRQQKIADPNKQTTSNQDTDTQKANDIPAATEATAKVTQASSINRNKQVTAENNKTYNLLVSKPANNYLIIGDIGDATARLPLYQSKGLLSKILKALGIEQTLDKSPKEKEFIWPISKLGAFKYLYNDINSATDIFLAFLTYQFDYNQQNKILVFGSNAAKITLGKSKNMNLTRGIQHCDSSNRVYAITYSLTNIIANPSLKRAVWQDISGLITRS